MSDSEDWSYASSSSSSSGSSQYNDDEESSSSDPPSPPPQQIIYDPPYQTRVGPDGELIRSPNVPIRPKKVPRYGNPKPRKGKNPVGKPPKRK